MALMGIAPWIVPPNYVGTAEAGARLGLSQRQQDFSEASAADRLAMELRQQDVAERSTADRLKLAYDQLAAQERHQAMALQGQLALRQSTQALQAQRNQALAQHQTTQDAINMLRAQAYQQRVNDMGAQATPEGLNTITKDGEVYQSRGGRWFHVPRTRDPMAAAEYGALAREYARVQAEENPLNIKTVEKLSRLRAEMERVKGQKSVIDVDSTVTPTNAPPALNLTMPPQSGGTFDEAIRALSQAQTAPEAGTNNTADAAAMLSTTNAPTAATVPAGNEVRRRTQDGRIAVFNADTKEFLRYADE